MRATFSGIPGFFKSNPHASYGQRAKVGIERASYYSTDPLHETLSKRIDVDYLQSGATRPTVGAVNASTGAMRCFDSREDKLTIDHIRASGAMPPAFPAVRIDGEPYWDGGIYSNTPVKVVLGDKSRRDSTIFTVQLWNPQGPEPESLWDVANRQKDIQFSSRANGHIAHPQQNQKLRHIIREMTKVMPESLRASVEMKVLCLGLRHQHARGAHVGVARRWRRQHQRY